MNSKVIPGRILQKSLTPSFRRTPDRVRGRRRNPESLKKPGFRVALRLPGMTISPCFQEFCKNLRTLKFKHFSLLGMILRPNWQEISEIPRPPWQREAVKNHLIHPHPAPPRSCEKIPKITPTLPLPEGVKKLISFFFTSFRRKPESSVFKTLAIDWTPVFTGVTAEIQFFHTFSHQGGGE